MHTANALLLKKGKYTVEHKLFSDVDKCGVSWLTV